MRAIEARNNQWASGFSLVEVTLAIAIVAVAAVTLISALNQSMRTRDKAVVLEEGTRIEPFVRSKLRELGFVSLYGFLKAGSDSEAYHVYSYSCKLDERRLDDGSPVPSREGDVDLAFGFRRSDDERLNAELEYRVGEAFKIRLTPFSYDPTAPNLALPDDPDEFEGAAMPVLVEIFRDPMPGTKVKEWLKGRRQLSFPVLVSRK